MLFLPLLKSNLSVKLSIKTCGLEVLLFFEFINIASIFYNSIDLVDLISLKVLKGPLNLIKFIGAISGVVKK